MKVNSINALREFYRQAAKGPAECTIDGRWIMSEMRNIPGNIIYSEAGEGKPIHIFLNFQLLKISDDPIFNTPEADDIIDKITKHLADYSRQVEASYLHITSDFEVKTRLDARYPFSVLFQVGLYCRRDGITIREAMEKKKRHARPHILHGRSELPKNHEAEQQIEDWLKNRLQKMTDEARAAGFTDQQIAYAVNRYVYMLK